MKMRITHIALFVLLMVNQIFAQRTTTVTANSYDISDNLDLRAVASIFGESRDLEDFERRLNDPEIQISNLDLNNDNRVDYLRVIEVTENNTHLIILQSVLGMDTYQDVATIEVERDRYNNIQVQVVGDVYMYGPNYIYEPVYIARPIIFDVFWISSYRPYYSPWYWGYYPTYYSYWTPYPVYRYRNNIHIHINSRNTYNYVYTRRSSRAIAMHNARRANAYERQHPNNSFSSRTNQSNRYALEQSRDTYRTGGRNTNNSSRSSYTNSSRSASRTTTNAVSNTNINRSSVRNTESSSRPSSTSTSRGNNNSSRSSGQSSRGSSSARKSTVPDNARRDAPSNNSSRSGSSTRDNGSSRNSSRSVPSGGSGGRTSSSSNSRNSRG